MNWKGTLNRFADADYVLESVQNRLPDGLEIIIPKVVPYNLTSIGASQLENPDLDLDYSREFMAAEYGMSRKTGKETPDQERSYAISSILD